MENSFFAVVSRMKYIERWSLMHSSRRENLSEHSLDVAMIAHALCMIGNVRFQKKLNAEAAALKGLYHDASEIITGDMPTPVKYGSEKIRKSYKEVEAQAAEQLLSRLPEDLRPYYEDILREDEKNPSYEEKLVKAADKLSALIKCIEERNAGNHEFDTAKITTEKRIRELCAELPEVKVFTDEFLPGYGHTLDHLLSDEAVEEEETTLTSSYPVEIGAYVTDAGQCIDRMIIRYGDDSISGLSKDTFEVHMTSTMNYGAGKGKPYPFYAGSKPLEVVKTKTDKGTVTVYFNQAQTSTLTWLNEGRNYPALLSFNIEQKKELIRTTKDGRELPFIGTYTCEASSWKDLTDDEISRFEGRKDAVNYQFHKGTNHKLIVFFHGNGEGDFPVKATGNNIVQILANRGGTAWVSQAQEVFGDASVMCFQAPNMWYFAVKDKLLEPCRNEILQVIREEEIDPDEVYLAGVSAGGFMSVRMIIAYPDLFKSAMITCPALDAANVRSGSKDAVPTDEELAKLKEAKTRIWLVQGETDSAVDPEECAKRIWKILTEGEDVRKTHFTGYKGIASGFTTYETKDNRYKLSLYETTDLTLVTGLSGQVREGGKLKFAEDYDRDGVYTEMKYNDHWSWIYTLRNNPEAADGTHIWQWAAGE